MQAEAAPSGGLLLTEQFPAGFSLKTWREANGVSEKKLRLRKKSLRFAAAGERRTAEIGGSLFSHLSAGCGPTGCSRNPNGADREGNVLSEGRIGLHPT